jgi:hypothetical protein
MDNTMKKFLLAMVFTLAILPLSPKRAESQSCPGSPMSEEWSECKRAVLSACAYVSPRESAACELAALQGYLAARKPVVQRAQSGVRPAFNSWDCPGIYPIKGNFTPYNGERCIFHVPGGQFYQKTKPEMCYANPQDAIADGCRQSLR